MFRQILLESKSKSHDILKEILVCNCGLQERSENPVTNIPRCFEFPFLVSFKRIRKYKHANLGNLTLKENCLAYGKGTRHDFLVHGDLPQWSSLRTSRNGHNLVQQ